VNRTKFTVV